MNPFVTADDLRIPGEKRAFWVATVLLALLLIPFFPLWPIMAVIVVVGAVLLWLQQSAAIGTSVRVSEKQFPEIYALARDAAKRLSMKMPDVYVVQSPEVNAFAMGFLGKKCVKLHSALVKGFSAEELAFIIGHEFAHIKCNHTNMMVITQAQNAFSGIPVVSWVLHFLYQFWSRKCEYTCDRGGLLACRDEKAAVSALAKLAVGPELFKQLNLEEFLAQHMDIDQDEISKLSEAMNTHPYTVKRVRAVASFHDSDQYRKLCLVAA